MRQLTIVGLASEKKHIDYAVLLKELDLGDVRELEDLIIDVIYADIIRGKLDQKNKQVICTNHSRIKLFQGQDFNNSKPP